MENAINIIKYKTPCEVPQDWIDENGKMITVFRCPYSNEPTGDMCRNYCGEGVDGDSYPEEEYEEYEE